MKMASIQVLVVIYLTLALFLFAGSNGQRRTGAQKDHMKPKQKPKAPLIDENKLPGLAELLEELELTSYTKNFIKMGVTETRLLLRLGNMDYHIMSYDWELNDDLISKLKEKVTQLINDATMPEAPVVKPEVEARKKLTYGRIYIPGGVQSFEYALASFGSPPPVAWIDAVFSNPIEGCNGTDTSSWAGKAVVVKRGNCTFLEKAKVAFAGNATALIIVNTEDRVDSPSSGLGVVKNVTEPEVLALDRLTVVSVANTSYLKLKYSYEQGLSTQSRNPLKFSIVPLKCATGGHCAPLTDEEREIQPEVSWGTLTLTTTTRAASSSSSSSSSSSGEKEEVKREERQFDFLTSNFGGNLPDYPLKIKRAEPIDACEPIATIAAGEYSVSGTAVLVHRGLCRFDVKALHGQEAGAQLIIAANTEDEALQRVGGAQPISGQVGIPSILVTSHCKDYLEERLSLGEEVTISLTPSKDAVGSEKWIELAHTEWVGQGQDRLIQIEGLLQKYSEVNVKDKKSSGSLGTGEIIMWLNRRAEEARKKLRDDGLRQEL